MSSSYRKNLLWIVFLNFAAMVWAGGYTIKELQLKSAAEYQAHQDFQEITIGAHVCSTEAQAQEIFDTDQLRARNILPVLVVVENRNPFAIRIPGSEVYLTDPSGNQTRSIPFEDVVLQISLKKPLSSYATRKEILLKRAVKKEMYLDFEHKSFGEKVIAPYDSDFGVLFFYYPKEESLEGYQLYFRRVENLSEGSRLMFFEFELQE